MKMTVQPRSTHHLALRNRLSIQFRSRLSLRIHFFRLLGNLRNQQHLLHQQHLTEIRPTIQRPKLHLLRGLSSIIILLHDDLPG